MSQYFDDLRIERYDPLIPPQILQQEEPLSENSKTTVGKARREATEIINGNDDRLLVVIGPCSIHDVEAAKVYGRKLQQEAKRLEKDLLIIMRTYFEKPRTTVGWKGLINDPMLDGSFQINKGLRMARRLLCELTDSGIPVGFELLDTISPQFLADIVSWGAIGARTTECQLHRELSSGVSFPVGFKNGTDGNIDIAVDAMRAAANPHRFLGVTKQGLAAIYRTVGNKDCHIILRGGKKGPNYEFVHVDKVREQLEAVKLQPSVMVDCSHGNSSKKHKNQIIVAQDLAKQISTGYRGIMGVMVESNLVEGRQSIPKEGPQGLVYGQSITDACVGWEDTITILECLAEGVRNRRKSNSA